MKHLYLATPSYGSVVSAGYAQSLALTICACIRAGIHFSGPVFNGGPYVELNRNRLAHLFLQSAADTLLFVDDDVTWDEKAVVRCYESGYDVVGGAYPKKQEKKGYPLMLIDGAHSGRYHEAMFLPGGFLMIRRHVLEALVGVVPTDNGGSFADATVNVFFHNVYSPRFCGEDVMFCNYARKAGFKVWCDLDIDFGHQGPREWRGNLARDMIAERTTTGPDGTLRVANG